MRRQHASMLSHTPTFAAIDFETADYSRDSACAVAVVRVEGNAIVDCAYYYIRPPRSHFVFSYLHGISWSDVVDAPTFRQLWPSLRKRLAGVEFLAAHNASFDRSVLNTCCERARLSAPSYSFECTVQLARTVWNIYPTTLPDAADTYAFPFVTIMLHLTLKHAHGLSLQPQKQGCLCRRRRRYPLGGAAPNQALEPTAPMVALWPAGAVYGAAAHRGR